MENALYITLSRQTQLRREMDIIANNIANVNTTAFKAEEALIRAFDISADPEFKAGRRINFVIDKGTSRDLAEGAMVKTDNPFDLALSGHGYFAVQTEEGERYTRNGNFKLTAEGGLVTSDGKAVLSADGNPIVIPGEAGVISISGDGTLAGANGTIGRLKVVEFKNEQFLRKSGESRYAPDPTDPPTPSTKARVMQGMIETSNVKSVVEMTRMIEISRQYQSVQNLLQSTEDTSRGAIRRLGTARSA